MHFKQQIKQKFNKIMIKLKSGAWPEGKEIPIKSGIHEKILSLGQKIEAKDLIYRPLLLSDIAELKLLEEEWFPFSYSDSFYFQMKDTHNFVTMGCFWKPPLENQHSADYLVGGVMGRFENDSDALYYVTKSSMNPAVSCIGKFCNYYCSNQNCCNLYIMTIGVADEFRRLKVGTRLLEEINNFAKERLNCVSISLHVLDDNKQAIKCYENNGFVQICMVPQYYTMFGKRYDGRYYAKKVNKVLKFSDKNSKIDNINGNHEFLIDIDQKPLISPNKIENIELISSKAK